MTYVDRLTRQVKEVRGKIGDPVRAGDGIDAHPAEFLHARIFQRLGEFERRAGPLSDGSRRWWRRVGQLAAIQQPPDANEPNRPNGIYILRFRNTPSSKKHPRFIRGYGYQGGGGAEFNFGAEGYGASFKSAVKQGDVLSRVWEPSANRWRARTTLSRSTRT